VHATSVNVFKERQTDFFKDVSSATSPIRCTAAGPHPHLSTIGDDLRTTDWVQHLAAPSE